jgi:hypothetical protein
LAAALLILVGVWQFASQQPPASRPVPVTPETPDDVTLLIQECGHPDADAPSSQKYASATVETRSVVYRTAKVKAVFIGGDRGRWKAQGFFDPKTQKPLSKEQLEKRLPCAVRP